MTLRVSGDGNFDFLAKKVGIDYVLIRILYGLVDRERVDVLRSKIQIQRNCENLTCTSYLGEHSGDKKRLE